MILETARDFFVKLRDETGTDKAYTDAIWKMRYPNPPPKASSGWPYTGLKKDIKTEDKAGPKLDPKVRILRT